MPIPTYKFEKYSTQKLTRRSVKIIGLHLYIAFTVRRIASLFCTARSQSIPSSLLVYYSPSQASSLLLSSNTLFCSCMIPTMTEIAAAAATTMTTATNAKKTVYLIRHAESEENRRMASFSTVLSSVSRLSLPRSSDVRASLDLLNIQAQVDSSVSTVGKAQIANVAQQLQAANFLATAAVTLVAHSPLQRAQETCEGLLQCRAPDCSPSPDIRVVSLDALREKTPAEWLPGNSTSLQRRLQAFQTWLTAQPESVVTIVGHSQYFRNLLNLSYKFGNCDVYKVQFDPMAFTDSSSAVPSPTEKDVLPPQWSGLERIFECTVDASSVMETK